MRHRFCRRRARHSLSSILLLALLLRALIPAGYMPSSEQPFTLQMCPDSFPVQWLAYAQPGEGAAPPLHGGHDPAATHALHGENSSQSAHEPSHEHHFAQPSHCVFAVALGAAVPSDLRIVATLVDSLSISTSTPSYLIPQRQRYRIPQPRAPPALS